MFLFGLLSIFQYIIGVFLPCTFMSKPNRKTKPKNKSMETHESTQVQKHNEDRWYPTAKNIFHRGYEDNRLRSLTPLTFFHATPKVKLYTYAVGCTCINHNPA